jgi:ornithine carbamoyltransferase
MYHLCFVAPIFDKLYVLKRSFSMAKKDMTIMECYKLKDYESLKKIKIVYIGDGNNISNSLLAIASVLGLDLTLKELLNKSLEYTPKSKAEIKVTDDINAVENAAVIYTDVWTSMGFESEEKERKKIFVPYQVNSELLKKASSKCIVLHCLPAVRGEEITENVMEEHENSIFAQAENRLHVQKAILLQFLK